MSTTTAAAAETLEKIRQQFNEAPYPNIPLEQSPLEKTSDLYNHSLVTAYYRKTQKIVSPEGKMILDVGCGSGYKSLMLAGANPGARIVGIDISDTSVDLARKRLVHYGFDNAEFHVMNVEDLPDLTMQFDYINCDEVLYLLTDPIVGLKAMGAVLKDTGIMRVNFHSALQRRFYHQAQQFAERVGILNESKETSITLFREFMASLRPNVTLKARTWTASCESSDDILMANHLLRGDKGWTIPQFFEAMDKAGLDFVSMVQWERWNLLNLFADLEEVPLGVAMAMSEASPAEQLHLYELLNSTFNRLLDLWCCHPAAEAVEPVALEDWTATQWHQARIVLHPQIQIEQLQENLTEAVTTMTVTDLNQICPKSGTPVLVNGMLASCLLTLFKGPMTFSAILAQWQQIQPINLLTLAPTTLEEAEGSLITEVQRLVELGYLLAEQPA